MGLGIIYIVSCGYYAGYRLDGVVCICRVLRNTSYENQYLISMGYIHEQVTNTIGSLRFFS